MKILLYNPNTSESITETLFDTAKLVVSEGTTLIPMTAEKGFPYISTKPEALITGTIVLETIAKYNSEFDAIIIAAFGDPGLIAARDLFNIPIIGLGEAAMLSACLFGKKFSIISFTSLVKTKPKSSRIKRMSISLDFCCLLAALPKSTNPLIKSPASL